MNDFPEIVAMVEDDPAIAREVRSVGVEVVLVSGPSNAGVDLSEFDPVYNLEDALARVLEIGK